jgi:hypothetical protein
MPKCSKIKMYRFNKENKTPTRTKLTKINNEKRIVRVFFFYLLSIQNYCEATVSTKAINSSFYCV